MTTHFRDHAEALLIRFSSTMPGREEDQLRRPADDPLKAVGKINYLEILAKNESSLDPVGHPDFAISVNRLLCDHVELKSPDAGTGPRRIKGHDKQQWERFRRRACFAAGPTLVGASGLDDKTASDLGGLLQDEPSNDLDVETLRALKDTLLEFAGCVLVISHDSRFLDRIATHIPACEGDSHLEFFAGNHQEYESDKKRRLGEEGAKPKRIRYKPISR